MKEKILSSINKNGFYFSNFKKDVDFLKAIFNNPEPNEEVQEKVRSIIHNFGFQTDKLALVYEDLTITQNHALHTHLLPCDLQVLIWGVKTEYKGRKFLYGTKNNLKEFTPHFGDICFMKANDLQFIHGVTPLESEALIRTLIISINYSGKYGEQVTVESNTLQVY